MRTKLWLGCSALVLALSIMASAQVVVVHDPTRKARVENMTRAEESIFNRDAIPPVKKRISTDLCEPDVNVAGVTHGAFTRPDVKQTLVFYQYCQTGNGFGQAGLVLLESGKVVGNFISDAGWTVNVETVHDINANGLDEFALAYSGGMHQGQGGVGVDLMEFSGGIPRALGWYKAEEFGPTDAVYAWKLIAKPGPKPIFSKQKYFSNDSTKYRTVGKPVVIRLSKPIGKFEVVK